MNEANLTQSQINNLKTCAQLDYALIKEVTGRTPEWSHFKRCFLAGLHDVLTEEQQAWALFHCTHGLSFEVN